MILATKDQNLKPIGASTGSTSLGLLVSHLRFEEKAVLEAAERRGIPIEVLRIQDLVLDLTSPLLTDLDLVLDRCLAHARGSCVLQILNSWNIPTVNSAHAAILCDDKAAASAVLAASGIPTLRTAIAFSIPAALEVGERFGYPLVVKPVSGSWGRLLARATSPVMLKSILEQKRQLGSASHGIFYLQEYIEKPGRDIRVIIIGDQVVAASYRSADHWVSNVARGAVSTPCPITEDIRDIALGAAGALEVEIAGVDLVETGDGLKVIEVNSGVEFQGLSSTTDLPVADLVLDYAIQKVERLRGEL